MPALRQRPRGPAVAAWISLVPVLASLLGCARGTKDDLLPQEGPTMQEVYDAHFGLSSRAAPTGPGPAPAGPALGYRSGADPGLEGYSRDSRNEIESQFPRLPNPDLVMYVFPHLSDQGYPVPGYSTVLPLFERVEYALPGEQEGWR
jgi:conjugative transfer region lipoprotein (TIGR03751 family)